VEQGKKERGRILPPIAGENLIVIADEGKRKEFATRLGKERKKKGKEYELVFADRFP